MNPGSNPTEAVAATQRAYTAIASDYSARQNSGTREWIDGDVERLLGALGSGALIADIGCGPAHHTVGLREAGFRAYGFDLSEAMLRARGVAGLVQADMRALPIRSGALDGIWCSAALLHVPRELVPGVLAEFHRVLRPGGEITLIIAEGEDEGWEQVSYRDDEQRRYFVYHSYERIAGQLAEAGLEVHGDRRHSTHREWLALHASRGTGVH